MLANGQESTEQARLCAKFITPVITAAVWNVQTQVHEEVTFTKEPVMVREDDYARKASLFLVDRNIPIDQT